MLRELQRVKSEGDFENLVENYGTQVDAKLHAEVLERYAALDEAAYNGFVNPVLTPVMQDGKIADITVAPRNLLWSRCSTTLTIIRSCLPRTRAPLRHDRDLNFTISSWFHLLCEIFGSPGQITDRTRPHTHTTYYNNIGIEKDAE